MTEFILTPYRQQIARSVDGLTDVVVAIFWQLDAVDGDIAVFTTGELALPGPDPEDFKPIDQVTRADLDAWLAACLDLEPIKAQLEQLLEERRAPEVYVMDAPPLL